MWFIGVEVQQETNAPPPKKNPGSAPVDRLFSPFSIPTCLALVVNKSPAVFFFIRALDDP